jgi:hypothetical protein
MSLSFLTGLTLWFLGTLGSWWKTYRLSMREEWTSWTTLATILDSDPPAASSLIVIALDK